MDNKLRTIMVVGSSRTSCFHTAVLLKRFGFSVLTASSAGDALRIMNDMLPSAVLSDMMLSDMDGIELLRTIKNSDQLRHIPVIMVSSTNDAQQKSACQRMGCAAFLAKPLDPALCYPTIQNILESTPRQSIRHAVSLKVVTRDDTLEGGEVQTEYTSVISEGGLYVMTINPRAKGSIVPLCLHIRDREIRTQGLVLYVNVLSEGSFDVPGMGIRFEGLADVDRDFIRRFIVDELTRDISLS